MEDNSDVYTIRYKKHQVIMRDVSMSEVRRYFSQNDTRDYTIEVMYIGKECCPETWKYIGAFPADRMNSSEIA